MCRKSQTEVLFYKLETPNIIYYFFALLFDSVHL